MHNHLHVQIMPRPVDESADEPTLRPAWSVRVEGVEVPVVGYALEQAEDGSPLLSLLLAPDSLSIGEPPASSASVVAGVPASAVPKPVVVTWGAPGMPDPRESIPGWRPASLAEQVATHAQVVR